LPSEERQPSAGRNGRRPLDQTHEFFPLLCTILPLFHGTPPVTLIIHIASELFDLTAECINDDDPFALSGDPSVAD
jgi:hypothetical protein